MEKYRLCLLFLPFPPPSSLPFPNRIRYGWFPTAPQRRTRGIRASDLKAPSLNCLVVHPPDPPKIRNPKSKIPQSKIQNPNFFGRISGILDFGSLCSIPLHEAPTAPNFRNFGFWISDFGFSILEPYVAILLVQIFIKFWILDFGFWILDFGFRILDFGFWISDFGFWILDFGFWILVWGPFQRHFLDAT